MLRNENKTTFVASVRVDLRHLAKIASYLNQKGIRLTSKGKIASEGLRVLADNLDISCETFEEALQILANLDYKNPRGVGTRSEKALRDALNVELSAKETQPKINKATQELVEAFNKNHTEVFMPSSDVGEGSFIAKGTGLSAEETTELSAKETQDIKNLRKELEI